MINRSALAETTVTEKFQITIPKDVRDAMDLRPGERMCVERRDDNSILVRRYRRVRQPLKHLIGDRPYRRKISIEELEERIESR